MDGTTGAVLDSDLSNLLIKCENANNKHLILSEGYQDMKRQIKLLKNKLITLENDRESQMLAMNSFKKMIIKQQSTISTLMGVKEEIKALKEIIKFKDDYILELQNEKSSLNQTFDKEKQNFLESCENKIQIVKFEADTEIQTLKNEIEALKCNYEFALQQDREKIEKIEKDSEEKVNSIILDYEEQLQNIHKQLINQFKETEKANSKYMDIVKYKKKSYEVKENYKENKDIATSVIKTATDVTANTKCNLNKSLIKPNKNNKLKIHILNEENTNNDERKLPRGEVKPMKRKLFDKRGEDYF